MNIFDAATPAQLRGLNRCNSEELEPLIALIEQTLADTKVQLVRADEEARFRRLQGRAETLEDLLEAARRAPRLLERL